MFRRRGLIFQATVSVAIALVATLGAPPASWSAPQSASAVASSDNVSAPGPLSPLGPGDSVMLHVFGETDMDGVLGVADDGTVRIPLAGSVPIKGLSTEEAARRIEKAFKDGGFFVDPHVSLAVTQSQSQRVSVLGEVRAPGRYAVDSKTTIVDLLAQAGGTTELASETIYILRKDQSGNVVRHPADLKDLTESGVGAPARQPLLQGGDSVYVPRAQQFFILGEVQKPGMYKLESNMTVLQAVSVAGGVTPRGSDRRVMIKRGKDGQSTELKGKPDDLVQPDDVIRVKERIF
jgi:polysaccharide export outer membrane protein